MPMLLTTGLRYLGAAGVVLCVAMLPQRASASLGGPETAVAAEAQQLNASIKSSDVANYRVHAIQMTSGTVLREFAVPGGSVFAVAWSGPTIPNLRQALGTVFCGVRERRAGQSLGSFAPGDPADRLGDAVERPYAGCFAAVPTCPSPLPAGVSLDEIH